MSAPLFFPNMVLGILPEIGLVLLGALVLALDLIWKGETRRRLAWVTAAGLVLIAIAAYLVAKPDSGVNLIFGGMLSHDWMGWVFSMLFLFAGAITALFIKDLDNIGERGEFYLLLLTAILGMCLMATSADLIMLFLAIETTSIPLYVLAGFLRKENASTEAGFKYFLFGAVTSAVMLYGFSLLFGFSGTTQLYEISKGMEVNGIAGSLRFFIIVLIMVGLSFKIAAFPFHFWAPDVYQGAPAPVAGFLSTASKAAGFAVIIRLLPNGFYSHIFAWSILITVISAASMTFGNLMALNQRNIKRLLAYSSIAQAGYMLIGIAAFSPLGIESVVYYLIAYLVTNLAAFGIISLVGKVVKSDEISAYTGLARRSPALGLALLAALLSLAGIPPFAGFAGKLLLFSSAIQLMNVPWLIALAIIGVLNSIIALYYYLNVLKVIYLGRQDEDTSAIAISQPAIISVGVCAVGILVIGVIFSPWFNIAQVAANSLFSPF